MVYVEQLILAILLSISLTTLGEDEMGLELLDGMEECVCPGQSLTYECTVMGELGGMTVWRGSVFDTSCTNREISLFRKNFDSTDGIFGECGEIVGRIVRDNIKFNGNNSVGYFVSQVSVPVSSNTSGKNIECQYDDGNTVLPVGDMIILAETGALAPPNRLHMSNADFVSRQLTFKWSSVAPDCPAIHYHILASNCGSCPTTTNCTTAICSDIPINTSVCTFAVQTVVCGNVTGNTTNTIKVSIRIEEKQTIKVESDSFRTPGYAVIGILLVIITLTAVLFVLKLIKRILSKYSRGYNGRLQTSQATHREVNDDISATIKTFDNIEMGNYSFSDDSQHPVPNCNSDDDPITLSSLLQKVKGEITSQWYEFGLELKVPKDVLDQLKSYSDEDRTIEILDYWLRHHPGKPTWQEVAEAKKQAEHIIEQDK